MKDQKRKQASPMQSLGGFVCTLENEEGVKLNLLGCEVLMTVEYHPRSKRSFRVRIFAIQGVKIERMEPAEALAFAQDFTSRKARS